MGVRAREKVKGSGDWYVFINWRGVRKAVRVLLKDASRPASKTQARDRKQRAEAMADQIRARLTLGNFADLERQARPTATTSPPFETFATEWLEWYPAMHAVRPTTVENYRSFVRTHLIPAFGVTPVAEITPEHIEAFIEAKRAPGGSVRHQGKALSDASLRTGLLALRLILKRAVRKKHLAGNPMSDVEWHAIKRVEHVDPFTGAELRAILTAAAAIDRDLATMFRVWMQTGVRAGEVGGLQWQDFDLERGAVMV
jgi:integrase